jgi:hypothetical protein
MYSYHKNKQIQNDLNGNNFTQPKYLKKKKIKNFVGRMWGNHGIMYKLKWLEMRVWKWNKM